MRWGQGQEATLAVVIIAAFLILAGISLGLTNLSVLEAIFVAC